MGSRDRWPGAGQLGRPDARQEGRPAAGRALRTQALIEGRGAGPSAGLDRLARAPNSAASSSGVGMPRTTLSRGSSSIDAAYDARCRAR